MTRYWKRDEWDDGLEKAIAFGLIASHRLEQLEPAVEFGGESLPFVIRLNKHLGVKLWFQGFSSTTAWVSSMSNWCISKKARCRDAHVLAALLPRYHALQVRKNFGKFQGDLYFTKDWLSLFLRVGG